MISEHPISRGFHGFTGCQRDPWDRGVTICLIKTLLVKPSAGKRLQYSYDVVDCSSFVMTTSLKTLLLKHNGIIPGRREKE